MDIGRYITITEVSEEMPNKERLANAIKTNLVIEIDVFLWTFFEEHNYLSRFYGHKGAFKVDMDFFFKINIRTADILHYAAKSLLLFLEI